MTNDQKLHNALWQVLDDMGSEGLSVCGAAKEQLISVYKELYPDELYKDSPSAISGESYQGPLIDMKCGYHIKTIKKGTLGEPTKVMEECNEFMDAIDQNVSVMALVELSDLIGAVSAYLEKYHPSISLNDLETMSNITKRAFVNGHRS